MTLLPTQNKTKQNKSNLKWGRDGPILLREFGDPPETSCFCTSQELGGEWRGQKEIPEGMQCLGFGPDEGSGGKVEEGGVQEGGASRPQEVVTVGSMGYCHQSPCGGSGWCPYNGGS